MTFKQFFKESFTARYDTTTDKIIGLYWIIFIVVWCANINDLIRGHWFYKQWEQAVFWNVMGILAFIVIIKSYKKVKQ